MGLRSGVADHGRPPRERSRHQRVLGRHHRRLVHEKVARAKAERRRLEGDQVALVLDLGPERAERVEVGIEAAAADHVAAGRRHVGRAEAGQQRAGEQEGGPDLLGDLGIDVGLGDGRGVDTQFRGAQPLGLGAEVGQQLDHGLDIGDTGHVAQHDVLVGEQRGGQDRQGAVLVAGGSDRAGQWHATLDDELLQGNRPRSGSLRRTVARQASWCRAVGRGRLYRSGRRRGVS